MKSPRPLHERPRRHAARRDLRWVQALAAKPRGWALPSTRTYRCGCWCCQQLLAGQLPRRTFRLRTNSSTRHQTRRLTPQASLPAQPILARSWGEAPIPRMGLASSVHRVGSHPALKKARFQHATWYPTDGADSPHATRAGCGRRRRLTRNRWLSWQCVGTLLSTNHRPRSQCAPRRAASAYRHQL